MLFSLQEKGIDVKVYNTAQGWGIIKVIPEMFYYGIIRDKNVSKYVKRGRILLGKK